MKKWWRKVRPGLLGTLIYGMARMFGLSLRLKVIGKENYDSLTTGMIFTGWHGKSMIPANYFKGKGVWALFSLSNDGEMQTRIFKKFGFKTIRGSTGRGGVKAALEAIKVLKTGAKMAVTPDGPRGPAEVVQGGVLLMAHKSGAALIPVGSSARPCLRVGSWDRYMIPWLFARAAIVFGEPIYLHEGPTEEEVEACRLKLEEAIKEVEKIADKAVGL